MDYQKRVRISQKNLPSEVTHMKRRAKRKISLPAVIVSVLHSETSSVVRLYARPSKHHGTKPQDHHCSFSYLRKGFAAFHFHTYAGRLTELVSICVMIMSTCWIQTNRYSSLTLRTCESSEMSLTVRPFPADVWWCFRRKQATDAQMKGEFVVTWTDLKTKIVRVPNSYVYLTIFCGSGVFMCFT